jgi:hypothetical protein
LDLPVNGYGIHVGTVGVQDDFGLVLETDQGRKVAVRPFLGASVVHRDVHLDRDSIRQDVVAHLPILRCIWLQFHHNVAEKINDAFNPGIDTPFAGLQHTWESP